jgi:dolichol-phosphate mannosyltransferase
MGRVCLILPVAPASALTAGYVGACRRGLERAGHAVEVLAVYDPREPRPADPPGGAWCWLPANVRGLSSAAMTGLCAAESGPEPDFLVVLDPLQGYHPEGLARMIEPLARGDAELTVARRDVSAPAAGNPAARAGLGRRVAAAAVRAASRPLLGASDPFAGLAAMTPALARPVTRSFEPIGSRFTIDLLVRSRGRRVEVPVPADAAPPPPPLNLDDLRHLKRLADDQFGNASRLLQFCAVGASGMVVDLTSYAAFQVVFARTRLTGLRAPVVGGPLDLAVAAALAIAVALTWNFSLNRRLTFNYARHGAIFRQYLTYALSNALGIALSFTLRLYLPLHVAFFNRHKLAAAVVGIVAATGITFSMARWMVFSRRSAVRDRARAEARAAAGSPLVSTSTSP